MNRLGTPFTRRAILACAALSLVSLPLLAWAQGSTPPAGTPATPPAATDQSAPAATPAEQPAIPDSAKAKFRAEVQRELKLMGDTLKITPAQKNMVRPILLDQAYLMKQLRDKYAGMERTPANREAMQKEMQALRESGDARLAMVLSGDQMTEWKRMRDERLAKVRTKMGGGAKKPAEKPAEAPAEKK